MKIQELTEVVHQIGLLCTEMKTKGNFHREQMIEDLYNFDEFGKMFYSSTGTEKYKELMMDLKRLAEKVNNHTDSVIKELEKMED